MKFLCVIMMLTLGFSCNNNDAPDHSQLAAYCSYEGDDDGFTYTGYADDENDACDIAWENCIANNNDCS